MKKIFLILLLSLSGMTMFAQKGMNGIGINLDGYYNGCGESFNFGLDLKYQYNIYSRGRIEPFVSYMFITSFQASDEDDDETDFIAGVNYHQFLNNVTRTRPYIIVGMAYGHLLSTKGYNDYYSKIFNNEKANLNTNAAIVRAGIGLDHRISHKLSFQAELTASFVYNFDGEDEYTYLAPQLKIGLTYNF
ncbi:MAG: hypothetical protein LUC91_03320 [Prevotella sp.]|nr:hypothetical protein [Prevotella sp.]